MKMIKIKKMVEYLQSTCNKCGRVITGRTESELKWNMKVHKDNKDCKENRK